ncbi:MAG: FAD-dependent oxidoreductase [Clostridiaceae bacterium]|nr:FAD-dependent oxidoreductase [Clostridiaceae bacterium]
MTANNLNSDNQSTDEKRRQRVIIVGGVAGGATAAARVRRLDENAEIVMYERGPYVSFANCGLPYYIGGVIADRRSLFVSTKETIIGRYNIDIRTHTEIIAIDRAARTVIARYRDPETGAEREYTDHYDRLLLATGSHPFVPQCPGMDAADNIFTIWTVPDTDKIHNFIKEKAPRRAVVVGGGFIGLEMAENLTEIGIEVTLVEMMPQVMATLDEDMAAVVATELRQNGVNLILGNAVKAFHEAGRIAELNDGTRVETDFTIMAVGVRPNNELAVSAGLEINQRGGIVTDAYMRTSDPYIYAVGDVAEVVDFNSPENNTMVPLAGPANRQGRLVARHLVRPVADDAEAEEAKTSARIAPVPAAAAHADGVYNGTQGTSIAKVFDLQVASTGRNEKQLRAAGLEYKRDYEVVVIHPSSHVTYYPGSAMLTFKLLFAIRDIETSPGRTIPVGAVLGAQIIGTGGADKRIDVIATAQRLGATVYDLAELELAYAPPYGAAKDPVNMAGFVAMNILDGSTESLLVRDLDAAMADGWIALDLRETAERMVDHIPGSIHIPLSELRSRLDELDRDRKYIAVCRVGLRGYIGERILRANGFDACNLSGGMISYMQVHAAPRKADPPSANSSTAAAAPPADTATTAAPAPAAPHRAATELPVIRLDACGLSCPGPIMAVAKEVVDAAPGQRIEVRATDPGFARDIASWCDNTGNVLISSSKEGNYYMATIEKASAAPSTSADVIPTTGTAAPSASAAPAQTARRPEKTMIIFSGDLDKAIAAFIIANGALAMGDKVNMFFTFWGLNMLRRSTRQAKGKDFLGRMFGRMMPRGSKRLGLSQMNFAGAGPKLIRYIMNKKKIASLEELIISARENGATLTACQMSMDVMGIKAEELIDGVEIGGVATMLNDNDRSNMNLFIS